MALATYKDCLDRQSGLDNLSADEQAKFARAVGQADALMAQHCGLPKTTTGLYTFESASYELYPSPAMGRPRALDHGLRWVTTITSLHVDADWVYGSDTNIDTSDLQTDNNRGLTWLKPSSESSLSNADRANKLVLVSGFVCTPDGSGYSTGPKDLVAVCIMVARHLYDGAYNQGIASFSGGNQSSSADLGDAGTLLPRAAKEALARYMVDPPYPDRELGHAC